MPGGHRAEVGAVEAAQRAVQDPAQPKGDTAEFP